MVTRSTAKPEAASRTKAVAKPMPGLVALSLELFEPLAAAVPGHALKARAMFGGWGFFLGQQVFALMAEDVLYLKTSDQTRPCFAAAGGYPFTYTYPGTEKSFAMPYYTVPAEAMESPAFMQPWALLAWQAAQASQAKKRPKPKRP